MVLTEGGGRCERPGSDNNMRRGNYWIQAVRIKKVKQIRVVSINFLCVSTQKHVPSGNFQGESSSYWVTEGLKPKIRFVRIVPGYLP